MKQECKKCLESKLAIALNKLKRANSKRALNFWTNRCIELREKLKAL